MGAKTYQDGPQKDDVILLSAKLLNCQPSDKTLRLRAEVHYASFRHKEWE